MKPYVALTLLLMACQTEEPTLRCPQGLASDEVVTCKSHEDMRWRYSQANHDDRNEIRKLRVELAAALHKQFVCESKLGVKP